MKHEFASATRTKMTIPTKEELRAATARGVTLSSKLIREQRAAKKAQAVRSTAATPKATVTPNGSLTTAQTISTIRAENFRLERELKAARTSEQNMLKRLQRVMGITV